ncbi:MAG: hypothetical protein M3137_02875 [Actinomycetota bacterium]|nr:hypothetical protein [Actinomycetota bacterium]
MRRILTTIALTVLLVACGGSGPTTNDGSPAPTSKSDTALNAGAQADFNTRAGALCKTASRELAAAPRGQDPVHNTPEMTRRAQTGTEIFGRLADGLRALPPPPGEEGRVQSLIVSVTVTQQQMRNLLVAAESGDQERMQAELAELNRVMTETDQALTGFGIAGCNGEA